MRTTRISKAVMLFSFLLLDGGALLGGTVTLKNSDRLTGEVEKLEGNKLYLNTSYAGVIKIDWGTVETIDTARDYSIETQSGLKYRGSIHYSNGQLSIKSEKGQETLRSNDIASIQVAQEKPGFWKALEGSAEFGFSLARGNTDLNQYSLALNAEYPARNYSVIFNITSLYSSQTGAATTSQHYWYVRYDRYLTPRAFVFSLASFQRNAQQELALRTDLGGGFGWRLIDTEDLRFSLLGGLTYENDDYQTQAAQQASGGSSAEALIGYSLDRALVGPMRFHSSLNVHPNVVSYLGRYRVTFDAGMSAPLFSIFTWNVRFYDRYDSMPPPLIQGNDLGLIGSVGMKF